MTFDEAVAFLHSRIRYGMRPGNERMRKLMEVLDNPQHTYPSIHVTGTNGKFSVAAMSSAILTELGLRVGTTPSPHVETIRERLSIDGAPVDEQRFADVLEYLVPFLEMVESQGEELTHFELLTAMAFEYFFDRPVHAAVVEVGLGGEYDATNVIDARVAVITRVQRDHLPQFGDDLQKMAWEKAGVIKPGAVALSGVEQHELRSIVQERAAERHAARLAWYGSDFSAAERSIAVGGQLVQVQGLHGTYRDVFLPLHGPHQAVNAAFAVAACEAFTDGALDEPAVQSALGKVKAPGRFEVVGHRPLVVLEGGHNPDATAATLGTLLSEFVYERLIVVVGMLEDKLIDDTLALVAATGAHFIVTAPRDERAAPPERLAVALEALDVPRSRVTIRSRVTDAVAQALDDADIEDLVLVFGSFYTVGEARPWLRLAGLGEAT